MNIDDLIKDSNTYTNNIRLTPCNRQVAISLNFLLTVDQLAVLFPLISERDQTHLLNMLQIQKIEHLNQKLDKWHGENKV